METSAAIPWDVPGRNGISAFFTEETFSQLLGSDTFETRLAKQLEKIKALPETPALADTSLTDADVKVEDGKAELSLKEGTQTAPHVSPSKEKVEHMRPERTTKQIVSHYRPVCSYERPKQKSSLTQDDSRRYILLRKKFRDNTGNVNSTEYEEYQVLQGKILKEQATVQAFLKNLATHARNDYEYMTAQASKYVQEKLDLERKRSEKYPRYYNTLDDISLDTESNKTGPVLQYLGPLLELGVVPQAVIPVLTIPGTVRPRVPTDYDQVQERFPLKSIVSHPDIASSHEDCSKDKNAEILAMKHGCHIAVSSAVLCHLANIQNSKQDRPWEMPISVRLYQLHDGEKEVQHRVVYLDRPLVQCSNLTTREKNTLFHKYALKTYITKQDRNGHVFTVPRHAIRKRKAAQINLKENKGEDYKPSTRADLSTPGETRKKQTTNDSERKTENVEISLKDKHVKSDSGLYGFGEVNIDELETFGMGMTAKVPKFDDFFKKKFPGLEKSFVKSKEIVGTYQPEKEKFIEDVQGKPDDTESSPDKKPDTDQQKSFSEEQNMAESELSVKSSISSAEFEGKVSVQKSSSVRETISGTITSAISLNPDDRLSAGASSEVGKSIDKDLSTGQKPTLSVESIKVISGTMLAPWQTEKQQTKSTNPVSSATARTLMSDSDSDCDGLIIDLPGTPRSKQTASNRKDGEITGDQGGDIFNKNTSISESEFEGVSVLDTPSSPVCDTPASPVFDTPSSPVGDTPLSPIKSPDSECGFSVDKDLSGLNKKCVEIPLDVDTEDENIIDHSKIELDSLKVEQTTINADVSAARLDVKTGKTDADIVPADELRRSSRLQTAEDSSKIHNESTSPEIRSTDTTTSVRVTAVRSSPRIAKRLERKSPGSTAHLEQPTTSLRVTRQSSLPNDAALQNQKTSPGAVEIGMKRRRGRPRKSDTIPEVKEVCTSIPECRVTRQRSVSSEKGRDDYQTSLTAGHQTAEEEVVIPMKRKRGRPPKIKPDIKPEVNDAFSEDKIEKENADKKNAECKMEDTISSKVNEDCRNQEKILNNSENPTEKMPAEHKPKTAASVAKKSTRQKGRKEELGQIVDSCPLDAILNMQSELLSKQGTSTSQAVGSAVGQEDGFLYPDEHNIIYHMWNLAGFNVLVRGNYHGYIKGTKHQGNFVHLSPKLEYQPSFGHEQLTEREVANDWMSLYLRPNCSLIRARINAFSSEIMMVEEVKYQNILPPSTAFSPDKVFADFLQIFQRLHKLDVGEYLLSHNPGESHCKLMKSTDGNKRGAYDLHFQYLSLLPNSVRKPNPWVPIDPNLPTIQMKRTSRIPLTLQPIDFKPSKQKKKNRRKPTMKHASGNT